MDIRRPEAMMRQHLEIFCCYARKDQPLLLELKTHLTPLKREGLITVWADTDISAGREWEREISGHLNTAHIILLLISPAFMASEYCYGIEMRRAIERHEHGEVRVIPIILRRVSWQKAPFGKLQVLPRDAHPVTSSYWHTTDDAFFDVAEGIRKVVEESRPPTGQISSPAGSILQPDSGSDGSQIALLLPSSEVPTEIHIRPLHSEDAPPNEKRQDETTEYAPSNDHDPTSISSAKLAESIEQAGGVVSSQGDTSHLTRPGGSQHSQVPQRGHFLRQKAALLSGLIMILLFLLASTIWQVLPLVRSQGQTHQKNAVSPTASQKQSPHTDTILHLAPKWTFQFDYSIGGSKPTVANGVVYVRSSDYKLYAIDATSGQQKWLFSTNESVASPPTVANGVVYVGSYHDSLYAIDAASGHKKWTFVAGYDWPMYSPPTVANGVIYIISADHQLYAIDAATGHKRWAFAAGADGNHSPTVADGVVYVGSSDHNLYAIDAASGQQKWLFLTDDSADSSPAIANGMVYVGSADGNLYAIDAATGHKRWTFATGASADSSPAIANGMVCVTTHSYDRNLWNLYAIDATTGHKRWTFATGALPASPPVAANGVVYISSNDGNLYAIDAATGKSWASATGASADSPPTVANGVLYINSLLSANGNLYAFALPETFP